MLKFITEDYLKDLYRKEPFTNFELEDNQRLTPGGRQYLLDKGIKINSNLPTDSKKSFKKEKVKETQETKVENDIEQNLKRRKLVYKIKALETLFLSSASEILNEDIKLAQKVVDLGRNIKNIKEFIEGKCELEIITPKNSDGNFDRLEVTDIYIHLKNSKEIFSLYYLSCKLSEFKYEITLEFEGDEILEKILVNLNQIENILSGIIKEEAGER